MDFNGIPLFNVMKSKLAYSSARQSVLAQNIANADTPGYQAKDVKQPDFKHIAQSVQSGTSQNLALQVTNGKHITGKSSGSMMMKTENRSSTYEQNPNGNNVVIEEEMMRISENQGEYQKVLGLYRKTVDMFKIAIGRPGAGA
jgi:flagellar basal-body rod protein FlgB